MACSVRMSFAELRALPGYRVIPAGHGKSTASKETLCRLIRYYGAKTKPSQSRQPQLEWISKKDVSLTPYLRRIRREFHAVCGVGDKAFWDHLENPRHFSDVVICWSEDHTRWDGFAVLKENYGCETKGSATVCHKGALSSYYVHLVCARKGGGIGTKILRFVMREAKKRGKKHVTLAALPYVVPFYAKLGFRPTLHPQCRLPQDAVPVPDVRVGVDEAFRNKSMRPFLLYAVAKGLGDFEKGCKGVKCALDGVYMQKCL